MKIGPNLDVEVPDECPDKCPGKTEIVAQGGLCHRCPVSNCAGEGDMVLLRPNDFRPDWAEEWARWFREGMKGYPELYL